jgi:hypothetical protein
VTKRWEYNAGEKSPSPASLRQKSEASWIPHVETLIFVRANRVLLRSANYLFFKNGPFDAALAVARGGAAAPVLAEKEILRLRDEEVHRIQLGLQM